MDSMVPKVEKQVSQEIHIRIDLRPCLAIHCHKEPKVFEHVPYLQPLQHSILA